MRLNRVFAAFLAAGIAAAIPSLAAEPAAAPQAVPAETAPALPADLPWLTPEPTPTAAQKPGPCTVSVPCRYGSPVSCSGQTVCYWQYDSQYIRGYVSCDGSTSYCPLTPGAD